jgi:O-succinylbenzoic acid--CoA ligase
MDWLRSRTIATPSKTALIIEDDCWSYDELNGLVNNMVASLASKGVHRGQFAAALMSSSLEYVCLIHALARLGAVLVPLNTRLTSAELAWQIRHVGGEHLIHDSSMSSRVGQLAGELPGIGYIPVSGLLSPTLSPAIEPDRERGLEDLQAIIFTSGTTGHPKGALMTYANQFYSASASAFRLGLRPEDRWLSCLPLYHVGGLAVILRSCLYGTTVVLQERFNVDQIKDAFLNQRINLVSLVPTMLHRLLDPEQRTVWPASLRLVLLGGAAASADLISRCQRLKIPVATTYGLTEAASQVTTLMPAGVLRKPGSVGKPLMFASVRIVGEQGEACPAGQYGEIAVSGPMVMAGYFNDVEASAKALRNGELFTGDIGYLDEDGDLWVVQRRSDVINTGGENVYPAEVETVLAQYPGVAQACVVGIDDAEWGQLVVAMVAPKPKENLDKKQLERFCRQKLASYKLPREFVFVSRLPQTASGKIHRQAVAQTMSEHPAQLVEDGNALRSN